MRSLVATALALTLVFPAKSSFAWSNPGHMEVAAVAWSRMTPPARHHAWALLQQHRDFSKWTELLGPDATAPDKQRFYFMIAATWPDFIRDDAALADDTAPQPPGPAFPGFPDMWKHTDWHYVDTPYVLNVTPAPAPAQAAPPGDAETAILRLDPMLRNAADPARQAFALPWLEHLVGDIHQPLHCISRYTQYDLNDQGQALSDRGGNGVRVRLGVKDVNLHSLWDQLPGAPAMISFRPYVENYNQDIATADRDLPNVVADLTDPQVVAWARDSRVDDWRRESYTYAVTHIYGVVGFNIPHHRLPVVSAATDAAWTQFADKRVAAAGLRLAHLLNADLGQ